MLFLSYRTSTGIGHDKRVIYVHNVLIQLAIMHVQTLPNSRSIDSDRQRS